MNNNDFCIIAISVLMQNISFPVLPSAQFFEIHCFAIIFTVVKLSSDYITKTNYLFLIVTV